MGIVFAAFFAAPGLVAAVPALAPCIGYAFVPGQGPSCPIPGGWEILLGDGSRVESHGPDPAPASGVDTPAGIVAPLVPPACASDPATDYYLRIVYARPFERIDLYNASVPLIREVVSEANGILATDAVQVFKAVANLKVLCTAEGLPDVANAVLPTSLDSDSFSTIATDLANLGYTNSHAKLWIWYDDSVLCGSCGGQGSVTNDDSLSVNNSNNVGGGFFAITYAWNQYTCMPTCGALTMLHEVSHTMGAVQLSAPHTSGAWHCTDGIDVMCYADGGSNPYDSSVCRPPRPYDCAHNDYFSLSPVAGSYLDTHWNLGSTLNRFIKFGVI